MLLHRLEKDGLIHPPKWLNDNTQFLAAMGSVAYGVSGDMSDVDVYGFAFPPKEIVFPHLAGHILGFGKEPQAFNCWQEHHIQDKSAGKEYDFQVYSIVHYLNLVMENNPNMVDSLFVPDRCVLHQTAIAQMIREQRKMFLHKGSYHRFKGYAYAQLKKITYKRQDDPALVALRAFEQAKNVDPTTSYREANEPDKHRGAHSETGHLAAWQLSSSEKETYRDLYQKLIDKNKRLEAVKRFGFDVKFGYHIVRLALECEQILTEGDLDLQRNSEVLKAIRRGEWTLERLKDWFEAKEKQLEEAFTNSTLPAYPDQERIKDLLMNCLEHHYGSLDKAVVRQTDIDRVLADMQSVIDRFKR